ncbi:cupin domain-containing protein [Yinghuangia seranimata]|uniref:cupin domain-containing protein n=1 Tax=Yinghuangia seranimata TaxID=408067 RepID=UPI00248B0E9D|nr:cupin domain-containing protein [Yinghuangia seranimata]MDI2130422.1 cupin domain-containing protein [Yinghuangia seranimata]
MKVFRLDDLDRERAEERGAYLRFLNEKYFSMGLYALEPGETDTQKPHGQDEVYVVISGRAGLTVGTEVTEVARGSVVFVPAHQEHRFHRITEPLRVLVFFSPPEA